MQYHRLQSGRWQGRRRDGTVTGRPLAGEIHAVQVQRNPPPQDPQGQIPSHELARIRRRTGQAWKPDGMAYRGGRRGMAAPATGKRGGQPIYSAIAIETSLALRLVFHQPLRQTEGLLRSIADVLKIDIAIPITPH